MTAAADTSLAAERDQKARDRPGYRAFLLARAISWTGSAVTLVALPLLVYQHSGSPALTGLLAALEAAPYLVLGLPAGAWADRLDPRQVLAASSVVSAVLLASIPLTTTLGGLTTTQLLIVATGSAAALTFSDAAGFRALAALVPAGAMGQATRNLSAVSTVVSLAGPAMGGLLAATVGAGQAIALDAVSFAVSALMMARLPIPAIAAPPPRRSLRGDIGEGLRWVWRHPLVRTLTLIGIGNSLTAGFVTGLVVVVAVRQLGLSSDDGRIGLLYAAAGAGSLVASVAVVWLQRRLPVGWVTLGGLAAGLFFLAAWTASRSLATAALALAGWQAANSVVSLNGVIVRQTTAPHDLQARVNTAARIIAWGGQPIGAAAGGLIAEHAGLGHALALAGSGLAVSLTAGVLSRLRDQDRLDALATATAAPGRSSAPARRWPDPPP
ncbi:MFS transporter [Frankia sp. AgB1.9]|uniref:MFS transporter n=1 Tax=unclassified Frankia TaxID=2632575 RepID=UPI001933F58F|nr:MULTISPECIES: MFS transporter [unclassified Frankia]MBL7493705.1 MFS transporter [Frankia sp. AgW1.1]MBL7553009.1 MFS transporter [Frankia sp. AgB1.9]MBL7621599.1 MFS transporter [Frankia sp. AgB1.8]